MFFLILSVTFLHWWIGPGRSLGIIIKYDQYPASVVKVVSRSAAITLYLSLSTASTSATEQHRGQQVVVDSRSQHTFRGVALPESVLRPAFYYYFGSLAQWQHRSSHTQLNSTLLNTFAARKLNCSIQKQYLKATTKQKTIYQSVTAVQLTVAATNHRITNEVRAYSTLSPFSTEMGNRLQAGIPPRYVTMPTTSTQPCIPSGSVNRVPAIIGLDKGGNVTSTG